MGLQPQLLLRDLLAQRPGAALDHGLLDCSNCARCDASCPSGITLSGRFVVAKRDALARERVLAVAAEARERYEARGLRLQRESEERVLRDATLVEDAASTDAVAAAIARAQAKRRPPADRQ